MFNNKRILIFGGCGSLGRTLIKKYIDNNIIYNFSRDENKHWQLELDFKSPNLKNIIGDIANKEKVLHAILDVNPHIIIVASAMKHIDRCEHDFKSAINNNLKGMENIHDIIVENYKNLQIENICFVSTDKACNPISTYGTCKFLSEKINQDLANKLKHTSIKCINVRYGNVLNSRGSIIPILKNKISNGEPIILTHSDMTRFIMTLDESVELIEHSILYGNNGETIIKKVPSMYIKDLIDIFCEKYNYKYQSGKIRFIEKLHEDLVNHTESMYCYPVDNYYHIKSPHNNNDTNDSFYIITSNQHLLSKEELKTYLESLSLL